MPIWKQRHISVSSLIMCRECVCLSYELDDNLVLGALGTNDVVRLAASRASMRWAHGYRNLVEPWRWNEGIGRDIVVSLVASWYLSANMCRDEFGTWRGHVSGTHTSS